MNKSWPQRLLRAESLVAIGILVAAAGFLWPTTELNALSALLPGVMLISLMLLAAIMLLVDQRMPQMTGVEFLSRAQMLFPATKKVLLTAYADTEAAIDAINKVRLDYYLMKPWDPPEENLYPILDDLLTEWRVGMFPPGQRAIGP